MPLNFNETTFSTRYKDDFVDSDGYYRILFNSGRSLQARELTQMQTIIQKQIERFGSGILKEGAVVKAGGFTLDNTYEFVKLDPTSTTTAPSVGTTLTGASSGITAEVIRVLPASGSDPATLYVRYLNTTTSTIGTSAPRFSSGESLGSGMVVQIIDTTANPATGKGTIGVVGTSIFFTQGFFVHVESQDIVVDRYSDVANAEIGFKLKQDVITIDDTNDLYDNQGTLPNLTAPGADRYRIKLVLTRKADITASDNFISIAVIKNGVIYNAVEDNRTQIFNIPRDFVALRIKENSGDYTVKPFKILFEEDSANTHLLLNISDGIAVVEGYRAARLTPTKIRVAKPTSTYERLNDATAVDFGNYVIVNPDSAFNGPDINTFALQNLRDDSAYGGSTIGTARVRAITEYGSELRYSLFDIQMNSGKNFRDVKSIGTSGTNYFQPQLEVNNAVLKDQLNHILLFPTQRIRPQTITNASLTHQRRITGTTNVAGDLTIDVSAIGTLDNANDWQFFDANGGISKSGLGGLTAGGASTTVTGLPSSTAVTAYVYAQDASATVRSKTQQYDTKITKQIETLASGQQIINLDRPDVNNIKAVKLVDSNGTSVEHLFTFDNGQTDNSYKFSKLILNPGQAAPSGNIFIRFDHFTHGNGNFFAANSYSGIAYNRIPTYRSSRGIRYNLADHLDFRSVAVDSAGNFSTSSVSPLPQPTNLVTSDNTFYSGQNLVLTINRDNRFSLAGVTNENIAADDRTYDGLPIYQIRMNPNTLNDSDVSISQIVHRRFTMKDIGRIEDRIDKLEEAVALNALENSALITAVVDSAGLDRTKTGIFVDNFYDMTGTDDALTRSSVDPLKGNMRPMFTENNIRLIYDSAASTNTILKGDNVYIKHSETLYLDNPFACLATKINPFTSSFFHGNMKLSPASDEWRDIEVGSKTMIDGGTALSTENALNWDNWEWNWGGKSIDDLQVGDTTNTITKTSSSTKTKTVNKVVSESTLLEVIGQRVLNIALLPFMRARLVAIKARGLRPNTNVGLFMDGILLEDYVREEPYVPYSQTTVDHGNTLRGLITHPDGSTALITDAAGAVDISFMIPNNGIHRFRCGTHEIKIMDITINREELAATISRAVYTAQGYLDTVHQDIKSTRVLEVEGSQTSSRIYYYSGGGDDGGGMGGSSVSTMGNDWDAGFQAGGSDQNYGNSVGVGSATGGSAGGGRSDYDGGMSPWSDSRLKTNIEFSHMIDGVKLYTWNYIWDGTKRYLGVMAQDLLKTKYESAVVQHVSGYYQVDYSKLPVNMEEV